MLLHIEEENRSWLRARDSQSVTVNHTVRALVTTGVFSPRRHLYNIFFLQETNEAEKTCKLSPKVKRHSATDDTLSLSDS